MDKLMAKVERAIDEVSRCLSLDLRLPSGKSALGNLEQLRATLESARAEIGRGAVPADLSLTRWVSDWLPDLNDPLIAALHEFELELERRRNDASRPPSGS